MNYDERSQQEFQNIRLRSFFKSIYSRLKKEDDCLPALHEILNITKAKNEHYLGIQEIPVEKYKRYIYSIFTQEAVSGF